MGVYMRAGTDRLRGFADVFSIFDDLCSLRDVLQRNFMVDRNVGSRANGDRFALMIAAYDCFALRDRSDDNCDIIDFFNF